jgi:hypothetical protein
VDGGDHVVSFRGLAGWTIGAPGATSVGLDALDRHPDDERGLPEEERSQRDQRPHGRVVVDAEDRPYLSVEGIGRDTR